MHPLIAMVTTDCFMLIKKTFFTNCTEVIIVGTPLPLFKGGGGGGGGRAFQKLSHLGGVVSKILLERGDNPEKGG